MERISIQFANDCPDYEEYHEEDIIFIPTKTSHQIIRLMDKNNVLIITYNATVLKSMSLQIDFSELFYEDEKYVVTYQNSSYREISTAIDNILSLEDNYSVGGRVRIVSNLLKILSQIVQEYKLEEKHPKRACKEIRPVIEYIDKNYMYKIKISELTKMAYMCNDSLFSLFKKETGTTPAKYILSLRIEASIHLLTTTDLPLEEIATRTGFGSATYMNRVFKQKLGCTPGNFRDK